jgi:hypothetical protein
MTTQARWFILGSVALVCGLWLSAAADFGRAADDKATATVLKVAGLFAKKDAAEARKEAKAAANDLELEDVMNVLKLRSKKGMGIGPKPNAVRPDGIEALLINWEKRVQPQLLTQHTAALERMAYVTAAVGAIAANKPPAGKKGKLSDWKKWSEDMQKYSLELADAIKAKNAADVKKIAKNLNGNCTECHGVFRD